MKNILTDEVDNDFGIDFIERFMANGFGAMSKSETDILVFHLLTKSKTTENGESLSNYEISNLLKITESRVKYLKLHASLRYEKVEPRKVLARIFTRIEKDVQKPEFLNQNILISLEDPVEKREFENATKKVGRQVQYTLNKEVLSLSPITMMEIIINNLADPEEKFKQIIEKKVTDKKTQKKILDNTKTLTDKIKDLPDNVKDNAELIKLIITAIGSLPLP